MAAAAAPQGQWQHSGAIKNITANPQLTFFPAGTVMSVGAFARITARVNIQDLVDACNLGSAAMKPLIDLTAPNSYARNYATYDSNLRSQYEEHKHRLMQACQTLEKWDQPDNFFRVEPDQLRKRSSTLNEEPHLLSQEELQQLLHFATAPASFSNLSHGIDTGLNGNSTGSAGGSSRQRRGLIAAGLAFIGGASFLYTVISLLFGSDRPAWEVKKFSTSTANSAKRTAKHLAHLAEQVGKVYHKDHFQLFVNGLCDNARALALTVYQVQTAFFDLQEGNVSPLFINAMEIETALESIEEEASQQHMHLAARSVADTLLLPAFGIKDEKFLAVVIPIPVITETLHLHRFAGTPLISINNDVKVLVSPQPAHSAIAAAGRSSNHILLNDNDLDRCYKIRSTYMCASMPTRFDREESCLGSLFSANSKAIQTMCAFTPHPEPWHVAHTSTNTYVLSTIVDMAATTTCPSGASHAVSVPWGVWQITVPTGCTTQTPHFVVTAPLVKFANVEIHKTISWDMELPATWGNFSSSSAFAAIAHSAHVTQDQISHAITAYEESTRTPFWHHLVWAGSLILIGVVITLIAICQFRRLSRAINTASDTTNSDLRHKFNSMVAAASAPPVVVSGPPAIGYNVDRNAVTYFKN